MNKEMHNRLLISHYLGMDVGVYTADKGMSM